MRSFNGIKLDQGELAQCLGNLQCILSSSSELTILEITDELISLLGCTPKYFTECLGKVGTKEFYSKYKPKSKFSFRCMLSVNNHSSMLPVTIFCLDTGKVILCVITIQDQWYDSMIAAENVSTRYNRLLENTDTYLFETDLDWNITCCTSKLLVLFPMLKIGSSIMDFLLSDKIVDPKCETALSRLTNTSQIFCFDSSEKIRILVSDKYRWFQIRIRSIVDPRTNELNGIAGSFVDIDEFESVSTELSSKLQKDDMTGCFLKSYLLSDKVWSTVSDDAYLLFVDLDRFKQINDTYGHVFGDEVIKSVAASAKRIFKNLPGLVCKFGGDEFCIYLPKITKDALKDAIQKFVIEVKRTEINGDYPVTVSIGVARYHADKHACMQDLIDEADKILYKAKGSGRDKVVFGK